MNQFQGLRNFLRSPIPLNSNRNNHDSSWRPSPSNHLNHIANGSAAGTRHKSNPTGYLRNCSFPRLIKQAFRRQLVTKLPKSQLEFSNALRHQTGYNELTSALGDIDLQRAGSQTLHSVLGIKPNLLRGTSPDHSTNLGLFILQGQIPMSGRTTATVGDLPFNGARRQRRLNDLFEGIDEI